MSPIELAEQIIDEVARAVRSGEWLAARPLAVVVTASILVSLEQSGYERGLASAARLSEVGQQLMAEAGDYDSSWSVPQFLRNEPAVQQFRAALADWEDLRRPQNVELRTCEECGREFSAEELAETEMWGHPCDYPKKGGSRCESHLIDLRPPQNVV